MKYESSDQGCEFAVGRVVWITYLPDDPSFATTASPWEVLGGQVFGLLFLSVVAGVSVGSLLRRASLKVTGA